MESCITLTPREWSLALGNMKARMKRRLIPDKELVALRVEWPVGVHGPNATLPGVVRICVEGLRAQGFSVPEEGIVKSGLTYEGLPLIFVKPVHTEESLTRHAPHLIPLMSTILSTGATGNVGTYTNVELGVISLI